MFMALLCKPHKRNLLLFLIPIALFLLTAKHADSWYAGKTVPVYFFWGIGCPHCTKEEVFLEKLKEKYPQLNVKSYEVRHNQENAKFYIQMAEAYGIKTAAVPAIFIGNFEPLIGYLNDEVTGRTIEERLRYCIEHTCPDPLKIAEGLTRREQTYEEKSKVITLPIFGTIDTSKTALPVLTIILAGLDGFNPCAFFVLFLLLSILVYAQSRKKMLLVGGIFVFFSGLIYFLFMSAWLTIFLRVGQLMIVTTTAGLIALIIASINIKDFFLFKKGISLTIPEKAKPKLFDRMRKLLKATSMSSIILGTIVLAIAANIYELICTVGFPMVFTRVLTLHNLPPFHYYLYLTFYNVIYVIPLAIVVLIFSITLGAKKLTEWQGQVLKLISGLMMLGLGLVLLINPTLFDNLFVAVGLLVAALTAAGVIIYLTKEKVSKSI